MSRSARAWPGKLNVDDAFLDTDARSLTTTFFISNLHCPSCQANINDCLKALPTRPELVSFSLVSHSVVIRHKTSLAPHDIVRSLEAAGFDIHSVFQDEPQHHLTSTLRRATVTPYVEVKKLRDRDSVWQKSLDQDVRKWSGKLRRATLFPIKGHASKEEKAHMEKRRRHVSNCFSCLEEEEGGRPASEEIGPRGEVYMQDHYYKKAEATVTEGPSSFDGTSFRGSKDSRDPEKQDFVVIDSPAEPELFKATLSITGMTCSSCVSAITSTVEELPWVRSIDVNLLTNSAIAVFGGKDGVNGVVEAIEDAGFEVHVETIEAVQRPYVKPLVNPSGVPTKEIAQARQAKLRKSVAPGATQHISKWRTVIAVGGMTCSSCVGHVTNAVKELSCVDKVDVNLLSNSATVVFIGKENLPKITEAIEDAGFDATLDTILPGDATNEEILERQVSIRIDGMYCGHGPERIMSELYNRFAEDYTFAIEDPPPTEKRPILNISYIPAPPIFTIRHIIHEIDSLDPEFKASVYHPPTIEDRASEMHRHERRRILFRLVLSVIIAIPTFVLGIVFMSLIDAKHPTRVYLMEPMWAGNVTRLMWALFILASPVYFFAADLFHIKALKEVRAIWRPGSKMPFFRRFYRFGSMNMLMCLGTSIAYWASVAELILAATKTSHGAMTDNYFDAVVFLTMFLLIGRFLEAYSKARTGDAVRSLGKLRPQEAILVDAQNGDHKIATDLLEIDDVVRVPNGASPPFDGTVVEGSTKFDESSLTGEARAVQKELGDTVYSGTVNKGAPVTVKLTTVSGTSMLDQIIQVVREGQTRRAPVERIADTITGHFVPFVVLVAISTWVTWFALGESGTIPGSWKAAGSGDWPLWSLRFAIAVFVIACPCGIGLAAPTALFVGGGLAARHGILVKGGGEAFQEASSLDCIVFDKTGTLTQGGDPAVNEMAFAGPREQSLVLAMVRIMEESSNHPVAKALVSFCINKPVPKAEVITLEEIPGQGLKGVFKIEGEEYAAIIGNENFMAHHKVPITVHEAGLLQKWQMRGESVALMAIAHTPTPQSSRHQNQPTVYENSAAGIGETTTLTIDPRRDSDGSRPNTLEVLQTSTMSADDTRVVIPDHTWELAAIFGITDPLRPEAASVIRVLQKQGIDVWMLSGDNHTTASAVGAQVGIPASNIIAGVLPDQKAEKINYLQRTLTKSHSSATFNSRILRWLGYGKWFGGKRVGETRQRSQRATIAMVGDGINDAPALSTADLSIAIGSGSDIALSSSSFILVNSHLTTLLTLLDLSRVVFRRVYFNFAWALVYNLIAMPVAAGVLYPIKTGTKKMEHGDAGSTDGKHIRLDPVWASLAMALSSVSVVCSSLALRTKIPGIGFRERKRFADGSVEARMPDRPVETVDGVR